MKSSFEGLGRLARSFVIASLVAAPLSTAATAETVTSHGISTFGELKYSADFPHLDYVNPDAPKDFRVVALDTPGFGQSTPPNRVWSVQDYAKIALRSADAL